MNTVTLSGYNTSDQDRTHLPKGNMGWEANVEK